MAILSGIHPVAEALRAKHPLDRIVVAQGAGGPRLQEIIDLARRAGVPVRFEPRASLDRLAGSSAHQGVVAMGAASKYADLDAAAAAQLVVVLDGVEDPHNLGAIIRTAHAAGAGAVIIPERRAAGVTDVVGEGRRGRAGISAHRARDQYQPRAGRSQSEAILDLRPRRARNRNVRSRSTTRRRRPSCSAAKARACTSWCASIATGWCGFRWRGRSRRSTFRLRREWFCSIGNAGGRGERTGEQPQDPSVTKASQLGARALLEGHMCLPGRAGNPKLTPLAL